MATGKLTQLNVRVPRRVRSKLERLAEQNRLGLSQAFVYLLDALTPDELDAIVQDARAREGARRAG